MFRVIQAPCRYLIHPLDAHHGKVVRSQERPLSGYWPGYADLSKAARAPNFQGITFYICPVIAGLP